MSGFSNNPMAWLQRFIGEVSSHEMRFNTGTTVAIPDSVLQIEDNTDNTKVAVFDASGITTGTTRTITLPDASVTLGRSTVVDTGGVYATPIVLTAADSGKTYLLDDAAGLDFTLPVISASNIGMTFRFVLVTEVTSNAYRFTAGEATDLLIGNVLIVDKDAATGDTNALISLFRPDVSNDVIITIAGADDTKGALVGGWLELEAVTAARWFVRGVLIGDGALATIFS
jgi:hypothetical protein